MIYDFLWNVLVECFGNATCDAGLRVAVATKRNGEANGAFVVGTLKESYDGFWNGTLAGYIELLKCSPLSLLCFSRCEPTR